MIDRQHTTVTRRGVAVVSTFLVLVSAGCAKDPASPPPEVALGAPTPTLRQPIDGAAMDPGQRYVFKDLLPGAVDVELSTEDPAVYPTAGEYFAYLGVDAEGSKDVMTFLSADDVHLFKTPYRLPQPGEAGDPASELVTVPPGKLMERLSELEFLMVTEPARALRIGGAPATAIDVEVITMPAKAKETCGPGASPCAGLLVVAGLGLTVNSGQKMRFAQVQLERGRVLMVQNLEDPRAQPIIDGARFADQALPPELNPARGLPYGEGSLVPDQTYGVEFAGSNVGATFRPGSTPSLGYTRSGVSVAVIAADLPPDLRQPAPFGYVASTEKLFGYIAPTEDLLVPEPGVDPRTIGPRAFARSRGSSSGGADGLPGVIAAQPWADVVAGPTDVTIGGVSGRSVDVRLRTGAKGVPCTLTAPTSGSCAVLVYNKSTPSIWLVSDRVLRIAEVTVAGKQFTVITSVDEDGRALSESLKLVDLKR